MRTAKLFSIAAIAAIPVLLLSAPPAAALEGAFTGLFQIGYRAVDVSGSQNKFDEDIHLDDGPRLFVLQLDYVPEDALRRYADRISIDVNNFGGDPFETLDISVSKSGRYDFDYDRRKSTYFYEDIILPKELAGDPALALAGDFHHFDFDRVHDTANFKVWLSENAQFDFGLNRYTKKGESTTTLDISRDEFELDKPVEESLNEFSAAFQYSWDKVTLAFEERYRDYENLYELFLPGRSLGEDPADATTLDFFFLDQPYEYTSNDHIVRLTARPNDRLLVRAQADVQSLDMDVDASESSAGIAFTGQPFTTNAVGSGEIDRDLELIDVDLTYRVNDRWALLGGVRRYDLDQQGDFTFDGALNQGDWKIETTSIEAGVQVHVSPELTVAGGLREESRDIDFQWSTPDEMDGHSETTDQTGFFASVGWRPVESCRINLELEDSSFDDPFTLTAPTDRQRYKLRGNYALGNGFSVSGSYAINEIENSNSNWTSDFDQIDLRLGYVKEGLQASLGYSAIEIDRQIDQTVVTLPGFGGGVELFFPIAYGADSDFLDGRLRYDVDERWAFGGNFRLYDNSGSFALEREDMRAWVEAGIGGGYLVHLGYRTVDYDEGQFDFDDYDADIAEISFGYRW